MYMCMNIHSAYIKRVREIVFIYLFILTVWIRMRAYVHTNIHTYVDTYIYSGYSKRVRKIDIFICFDVVNICVHMFICTYVHIHTQQLFLVCLGIYMCMCVIHMYIHLCICTCVHTFNSKQMCVLKKHFVMINHDFMCTYIYTYIHTSMYTFMCTYICTHMCIYTHIHAYIHTCMYVYIHIDIHFAYNRQVHNYGVRFDIHE